MPETNLLCAVHIAQAPTSRDAAEHAKSMQQCPYVASYSCAGNLTIGIYVAPTDKRRWIEGPAEQPALLGMEDVQLVYIERADLSSPWSRREVRPVLISPPCRSNCYKCPEYGTFCLGCPASTAYLGK